MTTLRIACAVALTAALQLGLPAAASACATCAGRNDGGAAKFVLMGSMILFPFGIVLTIWMTIRKAARTTPATGAHLSID